MKHLFLTEAFASSIIEKLHQTNPDVMNKLFRGTIKHGFSFKGLKDSDIKICTPTEAFEYKRKEGDKYIKIWMKGEEIYFVTWANTLIDGQFRFGTTKQYGSSRRDNSDLIGSKEGTKAFLKSNSAINQCTEVYMIPFEKLGKYDKFRTYAIKSSFERYKNAKNQPLKYTFSNNEITNNMLEKFQKEISLYDWYKQVREPFNIIIDKIRFGLDFGDTINKYLYSISSNIGRVQDALFYGHSNFAKNFDSEVEKAKSNFETLVKIAKELPDFEIACYDIRDADFYIKIFSVDTKIVYDMIVTPVLKSLVSKFSLDDNTVRCQF